MVEHRVQVIQVGIACRTLWLLTNVRPEAMNVRVNPDVEKSEDYIEPYDDIGQASDEPT